MKSKFIVFLFLIFLMQGIAQSDSPITIEQLLSAPFPSSMIASPAANRVAWIFNDQVRRNIWTAKAPDFAPTQLTHYNNDDGQEIGSLSFAKDGSFLVYVRGGEPNGKQEIPNPMSDPKGAKQEIWLISLSTMDHSEPKKLGEG